MTYKTLADELAVRPMNEVRVQSFGDALAVARQFGGERLDLTTVASDMTFIDKTFVIHGRPRVKRGTPDGSWTFRPEKRAIQSLVGLMANPSDPIAPSLRAEYLLRNEPDVAEWTLSHFLGKMRNVPLTLRARSNNTIRSFGSGRFNVNLDTFDILHTMSRANDRGRLLWPENRPVHGRVGQDRCVLYFPQDGFNIELPDMRNGGSSWYEGGIAMSNGETGDGRLKFYPYLMRTACENSVYVPTWETQFNVRFNHSGSKVAYNVVADMLEATYNFLDDDNAFSLPALMESLGELAIEEMSQEGMLAAIGAYSKVMSLSEEARDEIVYASADFAPTRLGVAMAITQHAHGLPTAALYEQASAQAGSFVFTGKFVLPTDEVKEEIEDLMMAQVR